MREIVHIQAGQCGNQIGAKVRKTSLRECTVCEGTFKCSKYDSGLPSLYLLIHICTSHCCAPELQLIFKTILNILAKS